MRRKGGKWGRQKNDGPRLGEARFPAKISDAVLSYLRSEEPRARRFRFLAVCCDNWPWKNDVPWLMLIDEVREVEREVKR